MLIDEDLIRPGQSGLVKVHGLVPRGAFAPTARRGEAVGAGNSEDGGLVGGEVCHGAALPNGRVKEGSGPVEDLLDIERSQAW